MIPRIEKLEALLQRIRTNAKAPRAQVTPQIVSHQHSPAAEVHDAVEPDTQVSAHMRPVREREVEAPLESRARLVSAERADPDEIDGEEVLELDDSNVLRKSAPPVAEAKAEPEPPPSSRRPIAEPAETPQEAQITVAHTTPPESGKQVAADSLEFDDDFTGVRDAQPARGESASSAEQSIQLQSLRSPAAPAKRPPDEMELELPGPADATRPPPGPLPEMRAPRIDSAPQPQSPRVAPEVSRPTRPVAAAEVADMVGTVKPTSPKTFGELLDQTLSL